MSFINIPEPTPRAYASLSEIDADPSFQIGTPENEQENNNLLEDNPILFNNARNALKQISDADAFNAEAAKTFVPGGAGGAPPTKRAQDEAYILSSVGKKEGRWGDPKEIVTAVRRQNARTRHTSLKYEALLENAFSKYGDKLLEMGPDDLAELIDSENGFEDESARRDFIDYSTEYHDRLGISSYHGVRQRFIKRTPEFQLGQEMYLRAKSSSKEKPFRFTMDEAGRRQFRAYKNFYDSQISEVIGGNSTDVFYTIIDMLGNTVAAPVQMADPDSIISDEWRKDPEKLAEVRGVLAEAKGIRERFRGASIAEGQEQERLLKVSEEAGKFDHIPSEDFIISDPDSAVGRKFASNTKLFQKLIDLEKRGAFDKRSRLSPVVGLLDAFLYGTAGLAGMPLYSTDPGSIVNLTQSAFDGLNTRDREIAMMQRVNEAIDWNETMSAWRDTGFIFPMGNQWYASNPYMVRGPGEFMDPFMAGSFVKWARYLKRAGMTRAAVSAELIRNTERLRKISTEALHLPPEVRLTVDNVRKTLTSPGMEFAGKELTDWDVLDIIGRGKGKVMTMAPDGTFTGIKDIAAADFDILANSIDKFAASQIAARARRAKVLEKLANKNSGNVFSQFGSFLADKFPVELRGIKDTDVFRAVTRFFENFRGMAQEAKPIGRTIIEESPNKSIAFGAAKIVKGVAVASGANFILSGGETANPLGGPGAYIAGIYMMNDILTTMEFAGDKGKFIGEYLQAARSGRQINGSVAAWKINEKVAEIRKLELELTRELTSTERAAVQLKIDNLRSEVSTWHSFRINGAEKSLLFLGKTTWNGIESGAVLDVMMEANDRTSSGAYALAGTMSLINVGFGSIYRNVNSGRIRKDQQRSVFAYNLLQMDPVQARRAMEGYQLWRSKGFGDEFIAFINQAHQNRGNNQQVQLVTPAEMHVNSTLLTATDLLSNADGSVYQMRLNILEEFRKRNPEATEAEGFAYANDKINEILTKDNANKVAVEAEKRHRGLEHAVDVLAGTLDQQTLELQAANEVLSQDLAAIGIPSMGAGDITTSFSAQDLVSLTAFEAAMKRNGIDWSADSLFKDPDVLKKFAALRGSLTEYIKLKTSYDKGAARFGMLRAELETSRIAAAKAADEAKLAGEHRWRPGQTFLHTDYATGLVSNGVVVGNGVYIVDHIRAENPDHNPNDPNSEPLVHSSVLMLDYTKFDPKTFHEEWAHKLFMAETFRDARTMLYRDAIGEWGFDDNGQYKMLKQGWAWQEVTKEDGTKVIEFPLLRLFAEGYASRLPEELGKAYMEEFDVTVKRFGENPNANQAMFMSVFNELFANAYAQRMLQIDPSSSKIFTDPTMTVGGVEGSPMMVYSEKGLTPTSFLKVIFGKMLVGETTVTETASILKALKSGKTSDLTPEARNFIRGKISEFARTIRASERERFKWMSDSDDGLFAFLQDMASGEFMNSITTEAINDFAVYTGLGGRLDSLIIKGAHERLLAQGLSPEIFGDGGWTTGVIFNTEGNPVEMPPNISRIVDMVRYNTRTRVGVPDRHLMADVDFWNADGTFNPEKAKGIDIALWAAANNKSHWLEPNSSSRFKPMTTIIRETNQAYDSFQRIVKAEQTGRKRTGLTIKDTDDGFTITGRFTKEDVEIFKGVMKKSDMLPNEKRYVMEIIDSLSEIHNQNVPAFVARYKSMQYATVNSPKLLKRPGGYDSTRGFVPISVHVRKTSTDFFGKKLPENQKMSMLYVRSVDIDAFARRSLLAWNGSLLDEKGTPVGSKNGIDAKDRVRAVFGGNGKVFRQALLDYLGLISTGGEIGATKGTTRYPIMTTVEMFRERIVLEPEKYGLQNADPATVRAIAEEMATIVHGTIGAPNIKAIRDKEAKLLEAAEDAGEDIDTLEPVLNDNERGRLRIFDKERSIKSPRWAMRDKNFIIQDLRVDRILHMKRTDNKIPWGPYSYHWNQVAYATRSPNAWVSVRNGTKPIAEIDTHIANIVKASEQEGATLKELGVSDVFEHGSGYKVVLAGSGMFRVYDQNGKYVGQDKTIGRAKELAVKSGFNSPISTRHQFDQTMVSLGFTPQGIEYINPRGTFIRRTRYISGDGRILVQFSPNGKATIYDMRSKTAQVSGPRAIAKSIEIDTDGKGGFDLAELSEAIAFSNDELTTTTPLEYEWPVPDSDQTIPIKTKTTETRPVFENVDPGLLEFMPHTIGRNVNGQRVFAKNNPAYYTFKRRLIDYVGSYKKANEVINRMKKELGVDIVETDAQAVSAWVETYIKDKQQELDTAAQEARDKSRAKIEARAKSSLLDPIAEIFAGANVERSQVGLPEFTLSPAEARAKLLADVGRFGEMAVNSKQTPVPGASGDPNFQFLDNEARARYLKSLNNASKAVEESRGQIGDVINQMWVNSSGYILSLELTPALPVIGGINISASLPNWALPSVGKERPSFGVGSGRDGFGYGKGKEPNIAKWRWTIYSPGGHQIAQAETKEEAFKMLLKEQERAEKAALNARRKEPR